METRRLPVSLFIIPTLGLLLAGAGLARDEHAGATLDGGHGKTVPTLRLLMPDSSAPLLGPQPSVERAELRKDTTKLKPGAGPEVLSPVFLADRAETKESITYGTNAEMERAMKEQATEEKKKEEKSWEMLQHMNIYKVEKRKQEAGRGGGNRE
jgi:hypothetical protein